MANCSITDSKNEFCCYILFPPNRTTTMVTSDSTYKNSNKLVSEFPMFVTGVRFQKPRQHWVIGIGERKNWVIFHVQIEIAERMKKGNYGNEMTSSNSNFYRFNKAMKGNLYTYYSVSLCVIVRDDMYLHIMIYLKT